MTNFVQFVNILGVVLKLCRAVHSVGAEGALPPPGKLNSVSNITLITRKSTN